MSSLHEDPNWPRAHTWLAGEALPDAVPGFTVLGAPVSRGSILPGRCDLAPHAIRTSLHRFSTYDLNAGRDIRHLRVSDAGDLDVAQSTPEQAFEPIRDAVKSALNGGSAVFMLGGDNSISFPGFHGMGVDPARCGLLTLDTRFDLMDLDGGLTSANPVRALLRDGLLGDHIYQIALQPFANSETYAAVAREAGIHVVPVDRIFERGIVKIVHEALGHLHQHTDAIYVTLDFDVMDRVYAPAAFGARPGGLNPHQVRRVAHLAGLHPKVRVFDIVEIDPTKDVADVTVLAAAACMLEFASGFLGRLKGFAA